MNATADSTAPLPTNAPRGFPPWLIVLAGGLVMGLALGVRHSQGIFLVPITMAHDWSRESFAFAIAVQNLVWGLAQPLTGMIADRYGSGRVIVGGLVLYAAGLVLMAEATTPVAFTLTAGVCIGVALSGTSFGVVYGALSRIFPPEQRAWALGVSGAIGGLGQFLLVPATQTLISGLGWAGALVALAFACAVLLPCALPVRDSSHAASGQQAQQSLGAALREAFAHRGFWLLNLGFLACGFQLAFIATHLPAYLSDQGLSANHAVAGLAIIALANVFGIYCCGHLGGLYRRKYLLSGLYLVRAAAMALFVILPLSPASLYLFCAVMGFLWLGTVPLTNGLLAQIFGVRYLTTLFGFVFLGHQVGSFLGVWLGGVLFDATGSYSVIWTLGIALGVISAVLHYPVDDRALARPMAVPA